MFNGSNSFSTKVSEFFVSIRKIISGEVFLFSVMSLWTIVGFPSPQQFQLRTPKEADVFVQENPVGFLLASAPSEVEKVPD